MNDGKATKKSTNGEISSRFRRKRSKALWQITVLIIVVYILSGLATFFIYNRSQSRLIDKTEEKLIQMKAENISKNACFFISFFSYLYPEKMREMNPRSLSEAEAEGRINPGQGYLSNELARMVGSGYMELEQAMVIALPNEQNAQAQVVAASDRALIYGKVPDAMIRAIGAGAPYLWVEEGLPEMGMEGLSLIITKVVDLPGTGLAVAYVAAKPMVSDIDATNQSFDQQKSAGSRKLALLILILVLSMSVLTTAFISLLIWRRILKPLDVLCDTANKIMEGDLDVDIPVRKGEEFEGLKRAFYTIARNLRTILSLSVGGTRKMVEKDGIAGRGKHSEMLLTGRFASRRSRTIYYITAFIVAMFVASALVSFFVFNSWQGGLIDESVERMVQRFSDDFIGGADYFLDIVGPVVKEKLAAEGMPIPSIEEQMISVMNQKPRASDKFYTQAAQEFVDKGILGLESAFLIVTGKAIPGGAQVAISSDESLVYTWQVPDYLIKAIDEDIPYLYFEKGIPELGLEGEYVMGIKSDKLTEFFRRGLIGIKSMHRDIMELKGFYSQEKRSLYATLIPVMVGSLILLVLLSFLALSFLIRRNITKPVDELSAVAEEVMKGNLDVEIPIREGEELEVLKYSLREMVDSFRRLIARSIGEE